MRLWLTHKPRSEARWAQRPHGRGCGKSAVVIPMDSWVQLFSRQLQDHPKHLAVVFLSTYPVIKACRLLFPMLLSLPAQISFSSNWPPESQPAASPYSQAVSQQTESRKQVPACGRQEDSV